MKRSNIQLVLASAVFLAGTAAFAATENTSWGKIKEQVRGDVQPAAKKAGKVDICHFDEDTGLFHVINISGNAVGKHIANHGDSAPSTYYADQDGDGYGDPNTTDACPNPGFITNSGDAFPNDASEHADADNDGTGDNADTDDDNDGVSDVNDAFPLDPSESADTDGDGTGDNADADDDNDGLLDGDDPNPTNPDTDDDGLLDGDDPNPTNPDTDGDGVLDGDDPDPTDPSIPAPPTPRVVEFTFDNVVGETQPWTAGLLSAPASEINPPFSSAEFGWTDTDGWTSNCFWGGVLGWGVGNNAFVTHDIGPAGTGATYFGGCNNVYGPVFPAGQFLVDLDAEESWQMSSLSFDIQNNAHYWTTLEVVAVQGGVTTNLGTISRCAAPFTQTLCRSELTPAPHTFDPGPVQIQMYTDSFVDAAYITLDNVRIEY